LRISELKLSGVLLIEPDAYTDSRGYFLETWNQSRYQDNGFPHVEFVQDNNSRSSRGVIRGLHFQQQNPQGKLIQVTRGRAFDVAVDIRNGSSTFGQWVGQELSDENHFQLWLPPGFAHGFCALSNVVDLAYKCTDYYSANDDFGIIWNDPEIGIEWPIQDPVVSEKDSRLPILADLIANGGLT
jgi:dTDP-4-dehydrorhamnose 3,5-epimerase